jgi:hypothetical protein
VAFLGAAMARRFGRACPVCLGPERRDVGRRGATTGQRVGRSRKARRGSARRARKGSESDAT